MEQKIKNLPESERPYEKFLEKGAEGLSNGELLALVLRNGNGVSVIDVANNLLKLCDNENSLAGLCNLSLKQLQSIKGIGKIRAMQLLGIFELSRRIAISKAKDRIKMNSAYLVAMYYMEKLRYLKNEHFYVLLVDTKSQFIADKCLSQGLVDATIVSPREVFLAALEHSASCVILIHNHPSGDPTPSQEDIRLTNRIDEAGRILCIRVLDHIIIGDNKYYSFKEKNKL